MVFEGHPVPVHSLGMVVEICNNQDKSKFRPIGAEFGNTIKTYFLVTHPPTNILVFVLKQRN